MSGTPLIEISGVTFAYDGSPTLEEVNLVLEEGDYACLIGPNGGGKTTLLKLILGLLHPQKGTIRVWGRPPEEARVRVGYIPQRHRLDPNFPADVLDVVLMGRLGTSSAFGPYRRRDKEAALACLREVEMEDFRHRSFAALSGGEQQRVLIARALACEPRLLLLDEPTANLDVHMEGALYDLLSRLNRRMSVALVSHDVGIVTRFARTVVCVNRRVLSHPTAELTGEMIQDMYGGDVLLVRHDLHCAHGEHT
ncbi:MAG: ABC transporter ATP-binding protein [Candidatus Omnitrophica bacterium]|nr:High-affinity zinc uptake system ATP-binding protein ZnuC [bacterium]NUN98871.1 ABC transporter ATP-binding protein [Candidatus Omnitrophota bacterium]